MTPRIRSEPVLRYAIVVRQFNPFDGSVEQAVDQAGLQAGNKASEAALAALINGRLQDEIGHFQHGKRLTFALPTHDTPEAGVA